MTKIVLALYEQPEQARETGKTLAAAGISMDNMSVVCGSGDAEMQPEGGLLQARRPEQIVEQLTSIGIPEDDAQLYADGIEHGANLVVAKVDEEKLETAGEVMARQPVMDVDAHAREWQGEGDEEGEQPQKQPEQGQSQSEEQKAQAIKETLRVGKRQASGGRVRIVTHVEEKPIEEKVRLREEELHVERRPVDRPIDPRQADKALEERTLEVEASREVPVVSKEARVVEEVVVGKTTREREEVVRDTARETKIEIQKDEPEAAGR